MPKFTNVLEIFTGQADLIRKGLRVKSIDVKYIPTRKEIYVHKGARKW